MSNVNKIEEILTQHPDVQEVAVIESESNVLVAYIVSGLIPDRLPYHNACILEYDQQEITIHTEDISYNGFCIIGTPSLEKDSMIRMYVRLPGDIEEKWLNGTIAWYRNSKAGVQLILDDNEQKNVEQSVNYILNKQGFLKILQRVIAGRLHNYLSTMLPNEKIPSVFMVIKTLPVTVKGLIDINALPQPGDNSW
ncbi:MAG: PilZ domain-containing protein [Candidatus Marithrix sp.]